LFAGSELGAETIATFYTLIASALMHNLNPYCYLLDLCKRIDDPKLKAADLVPIKWKERFYQEALLELKRSRFYAIALANAQSSATPSG
jgi:transposase